MTIHKAPMPTLDCLFPEFIYEMTVIFIFLFGQLNLFMNDSKYNVRKCQGSKCWKSTHGIPEPN